MPEKSKRVKPEPSVAKGGPPPGGKPPEGKAPDEEKKEEAEKPPEQEPKSLQPKHEVGTRKGCRRYRWELKDSNREFWVMGHAEVKLLSVGCLLAALVMFTGQAVHPLLTLIISMELSVFLFFILVYTTAINRYMTFILWPVSDLLNDLFATIFLTGCAAYAVQIRQTMPVNYLIGVIFVGVAALFPLIDICLQRKHFRGKKVKRNVLVPPPKKPPVEEVEVAEAKPKESKKPSAKGPQPKSSKK